MTAEQKLWALRLEILVLFGLLPLAPLTGWLPRPWFIWLYIVSIPAIIWLRRAAASENSGLWSPRDHAAERAFLPFLLSRFALSAAVVAAGVAWFLPDRFLQFPHDRPLMWGAVMILYPLFAVYPQELLFRSLFIRRYSTVFPSNNTTLIASAILFGWVHIGYGHVASMLFSAIGGLFFAHTFHRTGSLRMACLEHGLYGNLMFTIGLGHLFYSGWNSP
ncbi:MAG: CPBP family intramembrane metalloprotease [Bacteroidetes bacterium]|jgi:membrane protease YdiL (CAAX protease family)|nr:CPBP family intramembrane metalloprotease [Bacteroidota bacterium]